MAKKKATRKAASKSSSEKEFERNFENMIKNKIKGCCTEDVKCKTKSSACGGCAYFLAMVGAAVYYISTATGFWNGVWGVVKALLWPAFLVYSILKYIGQ